MQTTTCPCHSGLEYKVCCRPLHQGSLPETALKLMRSRFSAYALCLPEYIIRTTHPDNPQYAREAKQWSHDITQFSKATTFQGLEILHFEENGPAATVTFTAHLRQQGKDVSFTEESHFQKVNGQWLYVSGKLHPVADSSHRK